MLKKRNTSVDYRRVYEANYGPIPREENGRTYEIHHIDGDHTNNDPSNLKAVTLQEHYDIHYDQGDYGACFMMASQRMGKTPEEISKIARLAAIARIEDGTHNFLNMPNPWMTRDDGTSVASDRVQDGTHPFLGGDVQRKSNQERLSSGIHHLLGSTQNLKRIADGNHNLVGGSQQRKQLESGKHPSQVVWQCPHCLKEGKHMGPYKQFHGDKCSKKS